MASRSLGQLTIDLIARVAGFTAGMDQAARVADQRSRQIQRTLRAMGQVITGIFGAFSVGLLVRFIDKQLEIGDALNKAAQRADIATEAFTQLAYAANLSGVENDTLSNALKIMQKGLSEAASGTGEARKALAALGVTLEQIQALSPDKQFELLGDRISKLRDPADKTRAELILFGRAGNELRTLFENGAEGVIKLREEAVKLGQSFSQERLQEMTDAKDAVDRLSKAWGGFALNIGSAVAPALTQLFNQLAGLNTPIDKLRQEIERLENVQSASRLEAPLKPFNLDAYLERLRGQLAQMEAPLKAQKEIQSRWEAWSSQFGAGGAGALPPGFVAEAKKEKAALDEITISANKLFDVSTAALFRYRQSNAIFAEQLEATRSDQLGTQAIESLVATTEDGLKQTTQAFEMATSEWSVFADEAARNIQSSLADFLFDPFKDGIDGMVKGFADALRRMVAEAAASKLLESLMPFFGGLFGGAGGAGNFPSSGGRAAGGPMFAGHSYLVGEKGPEVISSTRNAYVSPISEGAMKPAGVIVNVINPPSPPRVEESQNEDGTRQVNIVFSKMTNQAMADGSLDATMAGRYGLRPIRGGRR